MRGTQRLGVEMGVRVTGTSIGYKVKSESKGPYYIKPAIHLGCGHVDNTNSPH